MIQTGLDQMAFRSDGAGVKMDRDLSDEIVTAMRGYRCNASDRWIRSGYTVADCDNDEQRLIVNEAEADNWKILQGQKYRKVVGIYEGRFCIYKARIGMDALCDELGMWDE